VCSSLSQHCWTFFFTASIVVYLHSQAYMLAITLRTPRIHVSELPCENKGIPQPVHGPVVRTNSRDSIPTPSPSLPPPSPRSCRRRRPSLIVRPCVGILLKPHPVPSVPPAPRSHVGLLMELANRRGFAACESGARHLRAGILPGKSPRRPSEIVCVNRRNLRVGNIFWFFWIFFVDSEGAVS
jgi:hypothetical protein